MTIHRRFLTGLFLAFMATSVWAQSWPTRPVRMIIAFPPGGPTDLVSRVLAQRLSEQLGQQVIVDNKPGAGGNLAAELAARATPDGYTIFYNTSAIVIGPALYGKVNYDTLKDFAPVALTASVPMVLVVNPQLPARSVKEFLDLAKSRLQRQCAGLSRSGSRPNPVHDRHHQHGLALCARQPSARSGGDQHQALHPVA
jgi:tripartite-type tricarboxylate transporter receptor subunit TctC